MVSWLGGLVVRWSGGQVPVLTRPNTSLDFSILPSYCVLLMPRQPSIVARLRYRRGWTQKELADRADLGVNTIKDIEQFKIGSPRALTVYKLSKALDVDSVFLFDTIWAEHHQEVENVVPLSPGVKVDNSDNERELDGAAEA